MTDHLPLPCPLSCRDLQGYRVTQGTCRCLRHRRTLQVVAVPGLGWSPVHGEWCTVSAGEQPAQRAQTGRLAL